MSGLTGDVTDLPRATEELILSVMGTAGDIKYLPSVTKKLTLSAIPNLW